MVVQILRTILGLVLILAVACGTAEAPDPTAMPEATSAPAAEPTAPVVDETSQPTATPQVATSPAEVEVHPGKLTIMVGDLATERFDIAMVGGNVGGQTMVVLCTDFSYPWMRKQKWFLV
jgi:hypothetical protein